MYEQSFTVGPCILLQKHVQKYTASFTSNFHTCLQYVFQTMGIWQFGWPVLGGKLVIPWIKYIHFGVLAFLLDLSKCFHLNLPSNFLLHPSNPQATVGKDLLYKYSSIEKKIVWEKQSFF